MALRYRRDANPWGSPRGAAGGQGPVGGEHACRRPSQTIAHLNMHILSGGVGHRGDEIDGHFLDVIDGVSLRRSDTWDVDHPVVALADRGRGVSDMWPPGSSHQQEVAEVTGSSTPTRPFRLNDHRVAENRVACLVVG